MSECEARWEASLDALWSAMAETSRLDEACARGGRSLEKDG